MVHTDKHGKTYKIDRQFQGVGRIHRASGTTDPRVFRQINRDLTMLHETGRLDLLRELRDKRRSFLEIRTAIQTRTLDQLGTGKTLQNLVTAMRAWRDGLMAPDDVSAKHHESLGTSIDRIEAHAKDATVHEAAEALETIKGAPWAKQHRRSFNLLRDAMRAFVRDTLKKNHPLYGAVAAVAPLKAPVKRVPVRLTPDEMRALFPAPETDHVDALAWTMATTGMHQAELWGRWSLKEDRIHVHGTKRAGRDREVPLVLRPAVPRIHRRTFENKVRERTRDIVAYQLRGTYSHWMELAQIPRSRRQMYLGHGTKDVTDLYERHEVEAFLAEDARKLREFLGLSPEKSPDLRLEKA